MNRAVFSMWVFGAVALLIAAMAFGIGQVWAGMGVPFVAGTSLLWVAYVSNRARRMTKNG